MNYFWLTLSIGRKFELRKKNFDWCLWSFPFTMWHVNFLWNNLLSRTNCPCETHPKAGLGFNTGGIWLWAIELQHLISELLRHSNTGLLIVCYSYHSCSELVVFGCTQLCLYYALCTLLNISPKCYFVSYSNLAKVFT